MPNIQQCFRRLPTHHAWMWSRCNTWLHVLRPDEIRLLFCVNLSYRSDSTCIVLYHFRPKLMGQIEYSFQDGQKISTKKNHDMSLLEQSHSSKTDHIHVSGRYDLSLPEQSHSSKTDHIHGSGWFSQNCKAILEHSAATTLKNLQKVSQPRGKFCFGFQNLQCGVPLPVPVLVNEWCPCVECWCICSECGAKLLSEVPPQNSKTSFPNKRTGSTLASIAHREQLQTRDKCETM